MKKWLAMISLSVEMTLSLYFCYEQPLTMCACERERESVCAKEVSSFQGWCSYQVARGAAKNMIVKKLQTMLS